VLVCIASVPDSFLEVVREDLVDSLGCLGMGVRVTLATVNRPSPETTSFSRRLLGAGRPVDGLGALGLSEESRLGGEAGRRLLCGDSVEVISSGPDPLESLRVGDSPGEGGLDKRCFLFKLF